MKTIAQIKAGEVVNVCLWDGAVDFDVSAGGAFTAVDVSFSSPRPGPGCSYAGGAFAPPPTAAPAPDAAGFGAAVMTSAAVSAAVRLQVGAWVPSLQLAIEAGNVPLIASTWALLVASLPIGAADRAAVAALASAHAVPGIT